MSWCCCCLGNTLQTENVLFPTENWRLSISLSPALRLWFKDGESILDIISRILYNITVCRPVLSRKPSSQALGSCTALHFSLPSIQSLLWINVMLRCTGSFQSSRELLNRLWGFSFKFILPLMQNWNWIILSNLKRVAAAQFLSYFTIVTKTHRENCTNLISPVCCCITVWFIALSEPCAQLTSSHTPKYILHV